MYALFRQLKNYLTNALDIICELVGQVVSLLKKVFYDFNEPYDDRVYGFSLNTLKYYGSTQRGYIIKIS